MNYNKLAAFSLATNVTLLKQFFILFFPNSLSSNNANTDVVALDYVLIVDGKPAGFIELKREDQGEKLTAHEDQSRDYAISKLKYLDDPVPFVYESTGVLTRFTEHISGIFVNSH